MPHIDSPGAWISPNILISISIFCYQRSLNLRKNHSEIGRHHYLHANKHKQMCKHWHEIFLTFLCSFDTQMPQGHWYNLVIPWGFLQIYRSPHNDWNSLRHLFTYCCPIHSHNKDCEVTLGNQAPKWCIQCLLSPVESIRGKSRWCLVLQHLIYYIASLLISTCCLQWICSSTWKAMCHTMCF